MSTRSRLRRRACLAALLATAALAAVPRPAAAAPSPAETIRGTYRLAGTARVDAGPALSRNVEGRADAVLSPGRGPRAVRARILADGRACELEATLGEGGALAFAPGQRCAFDVADEGARGRVEARLSAGTGRCADGRLSLDLSFALEGALALRTAQRVEVMGSTIELPAARTPELPLRGEARAAAEGKRDESRGEAR